ncbi:uncharacterized protein LOC141683052 [Apium graveolens]|uniref:uncharacterized protein LOC141683052 n=1 Tax=Apium graveolens TaxID=4045 RepID=UPI003D79B221
MFINRMTVESLVGATCAGELQVKVVTLKATITAMNNRFGWYYISCKSCVKRGTLRDGVYICNNCKKPIELPLAIGEPDKLIEIIKSAMEEGHGAGLMEAPSRSYADGSPDQCGKAAIGAKYWFEEKKTGSGSRFHLIMDSDFGYIPIQHVGNSEATIAI